ncbi:MAG: type I-C CRISPR-associated protein Cas7/Csd2 [Nitrospirae bacterium]|nr:type I-C CRISPR-associated protein Cas7/Csd2 [Nitrospirota bacterium]
MSNTINNRYDFVLFFDVKDGNPNGDPDAGNLPRVDPETGHGLVTDVCLKRKVRNYVQLKSATDEFKDKKGFDIYVKEKAILNLQNKRAYDALGVDLTSETTKRKGGDKVEDARVWMCQNFYDVRTFGAVMSLGVNCGQVRGPVQLTFARSVNQVVPLEHSITRMAVATEAEAEKQQGDNRTMGRKFTIPYGLYRCHGFISASFAAQTGFSEDDLTLFWKGLLEMFEHDHSAARGQMATRKLIVFKHDSSLGSAPAHELFDMVTTKTNANPVRDFSEYEITIPTQADMPQGVTLEVKL